ARPSPEGTQAAELPTRIRQACPAMRCRGRRPPSLSAAPGRARIDRPGTADGRAPHQGGAVPDGQEPGQFRVRGDPFAQQDIGAGACPQRVVEDLGSIREPGVFIVDDVAFVHERHGMEIGEAIARAGIRKRYYLETRGDVLLRNKEVFRLWQRLGLKTMFLGLEAIDEEGLRKYRKRVPLGR